MKIAIFRHVANIVIIVIKNVNVMDFVYFVAIVPRKEPFMIRKYHAWYAIDDVGVYPFSLKVSKKVDGLKRILDKIHVWFYITLQMAFQFFTEINISKM